MLQDVVLTPRGNPQVSLDLNEVFKRASAPGFHTQAAAHAVRRASFQPACSQPRA